MDGYNRRAPRYQPWNQNFGNNNLPRQYWANPGRYENNNPGRTSFDPGNAPGVQQGTPTSMPMTAAYNNSGVDYGAEKTYESSYNDWMKQLTDYLGGGGNMGGTGFDWSGWLSKRPQIGGYNY